MRRRKGDTDEEHKARCREWYRKYKKEHPKCSAEAAKRHRRKYPEENKEYRMANAGRLAQLAKEIVKKKKQEDPDWERKKYKKYRNSMTPKKEQEFKRKSAERNQRYREAHPEKIKEKQDKCNALRKIDIQLALNTRVGNAIRGLLLAKKPRNSHWPSLVGYNVAELKQRLQATLPERCTWDEFLSGELHIDHIIPQSMFNIKSVEDIDFKRCWSLGNLQLLLAKKNISKSNKIDKPFQPALAITA